MPNEFDGAKGEQDELRPLPPDMRAAFQGYPRPRADAGFDAKFWRELDSRRNRYKGFAGFWRRLVEVEIEGIAVWRLGASTCAGAGLCALGFALLSWTIMPKTAPTPPVSMALSPDTPLSRPRFARGLWDDDDPLPRPPTPPRSRPSYPSLPASSRRQSAYQEKSCASFALNLA